MCRSLSAARGSISVLLTEGLSPIPAVPAEVRTLRERFGSPWDRRILRRLCRARRGDGREAEPERHPARAAGGRCAGGNRPALALLAEHAAARRAQLGRPLCLVPAARALLTRGSRPASKRWWRRRLWTRPGALWGLDPSLPAAKALGLPQFARHLAGESAFRRGHRRCRLATRQYAKRQMTWFRRDEGLEMARRRRF